MSKEASNFTFFTADHTANAVPPLRLARSAKISYAEVVAYAPLACNDKEDPYLGAIPFLVADTSCTQNHSFI